MKIPLNDLIRDQSSIQNKIENAVIGVLRSGSYINGLQVKEFETRFSSYLNTSNRGDAKSRVVGCSSGTDALILALMALEIGPGDQVLVPSFSFGAPAEAVKRVGADVVFVDVDKQSYNIDPEDLLKRITHKTKAIIAVHLFGQCAPLKQLKDIAQAHHLYLIEDAAQAIGSTHFGHLSGTLGDIGCFSFYPTKNIGACGDAGALCTSSETLEERVRLLRNHGYRKKYHHEKVGGNFRLDEIQAAILNVKLPYTDIYNTQRRRIAEVYNSKLPQNIRPVIQEGNTHVFHRYMIRSPQRDSIIQKLNAHNIANEVYYPEALHKQKCFDAEANLPVSEELTKHLLALPLFPTMRESEISRVIEILQT